MRRILIAILSTGFATGALAQAPLESCSEIPALAADVMRSRQINYDIMLMLNRMGAELSDHFELMTWAQAMIDMAYSQPIAASPEARSQQVTDFQTLWQARCVGKIPQ